MYSHKLSAPQSERIIMNNRLVYALFPLCGLIAACSGATGEEDASAQKGVVGNASVINPTESAPVTPGVDDSAVMEQNPDVTVVGTNPPLAGAPLAGALEDVIGIDSWGGYNGEGTQAWELQDDGTGNMVLYNSTAADGASGKSVSLSIAPAGLSSDMARSMGIRFNISGTVASALFQPQVGGTIPEASGGWCDSTKVVACWNSHEGSLAVTQGEYTTVEYYWDEMTQGYGIEADEKTGLAANRLVLFPEEILILSWIIPKDVAGEIFVDNITLIPDDGSRTTSGVGELIVRATFSAITGNSTQYTYDGFLEAAGAFKAFGGGLDEVWAKRELAMFFANAQWETGSFQYTEERPELRGTYCDSSKSYGCPAGTDQYFGRGSMQLSWNYNYKAAGDYLGIDFLNEPSLGTQPANLWRTGLWFWMVGADGAENAPHTLFKSGFGATINRINGIQECNGAAPDKVKGRQQNYTQILGLMKVEAGDTNTDC